MLRRPRKKRKRTSRWKKKLLLERCMKVGSLTRLPWLPPKQAAEGQLLVKADID